MSEIRDGWRKSNPSSSLRTAEQPPGSVKSALETLTRLSAQIADVATLLRAVPESGREEFALRLSAVADAFSEIRCPTGSKALDVELRQVKSELSDAAHSFAPAKLH